MWNKPFTGIDEEGMGEADPTRRALFVGLIAAYASKDAAQPKQKVANDIRKL